MTNRILHRVALLSALLSAPCMAQSPPPIRQIGTLEHVTSLPLKSVMAALPMPNGSVLVNDGRSRKLLLFDSTLSSATVVADTTEATSNSYGRNAEVLFRFRSDTALLVDISSLVSLVVGPEGVINRVMAFPQPPGWTQQQIMIGAGNGTPALDARGRLVFLNGSAIATTASVTMLSTGIVVDSTRPGFDDRLRNFVKMMSTSVDSAVVFRVDLATRKFDSVTKVKVPQYMRTLKTDENGGLLAIEQRPDVLSLADDWAALADGSIAVLRGRDYHIDWLDANDKWTSTPKMPFTWQRLTDAQKETLIDSVTKALREVIEGPPGGPEAPGRGGRGGRLNNAPNVVVRPTLADVGEYFPPFRRGSMRADREGNVWIRTSTMVDNRPVYDVVNRRGELFDRVQLPQFRELVGFGRGVVYLAVQDSTNSVRLERAKVK